MEMDQKDDNGWLGCVIVPIFLFMAYAMVAPSEEERREWRATVADIEAEVRAQDQVASRLRDPASAQYSSSRASSRTEGVRCGHVNANNVFGGRTGSQRYIATPGGALLEEDVSPTEMDTAWESLC